MYTRDLAAYAVIAVGTKWRHGCCQTENLVGLNVL